MTRLHPGAQRLADILRAKGLVGSLEDRQDLAVAGRERLGRRGAVLGAAALITASTCSPSGQAPSDGKPTPSQKQVSDQARLCSKTVTKALALSWNTTLGGPSGTEVNQAIVHFLVDTQNRPEGDIYQAYWCKGLADLTHGQVDKDKPLVSLTHRYRPQVTKACADAYPS